MSDLLTLEKAAEKLGICVRTLRDHVRYGEISYIVLGRGVKRRRRMFDEADLEAFKERQRRIDQCQSTSQKTRRSSISTSNVPVVAFTALRNARRKERRKPSNV